MKVESTDPGFNLPQIYSFEECVKMDSDSSSSLEKEYFDESINQLNLDIINEECSEIKDGYEDLAVKNVALKK